MPLLTAADSIYSAQDTAATQNNVDNTFRERMHKRFVVLSRFLCLQTKTSWLTRGKQHGASLSFRPRKISSRTVAIVQFQPTFWAVFALCPTQCFRLFVLDSQYVQMK